MIFYNRNIIEAGDGYEVIAGRGRKKFIQGVGDDIGIQSFSVDAVYDGEEALNYLINGNYDGAILDIMMPRWTG